MHRLARVTLLFLLTLGFSPSARGANKLWLVWDSNTATCKDKTIDFFNCILNDTNFNKLAMTYSTGEALTLAGTHVLTTSCGATDWNCMEQDAKFALTKYDVFLRFYGTGWVGGTNGTFTVTNVPGVGSVFVNVAWVQSGSSCNGQTCTGAHEAYEAAADSAAADCCNGQTSKDSCSQCPLSCAVYKGNTGTPPWGCYDLTCPNGTYKMELLSPGSAEFDPNACEKLVFTNTCKAVDTACSKDSDCCSGLVCKYWDYDGKAPYATNCCKAVGSACAANTDCCGGSNCTGGKCTCVAEGQWCLNADDCCSGSTCDLTGHVCVSLDAGSDGSAGAAGAAGAGGAATGGNGGWAATDSGLNPGTGGHKADAGDATSNENPGCSCRTGREPGRGSLGLALALAAFAARRRRR